MKKILGIISTVLVFTACGGGEKKEGSTEATASTEVKAVVEAPKPLSENPDYQNIYIQEGQELVIWGVVTYNLKPMR